MKKQLEMDEKSFAKRSPNNNASNVSPSSPIILSLCLNESKRSTAGAGFHLFDMLSNEETHESNANSNRSKSNSNCRRSLPMKTTDQFLPELKIEEPFYYEDSKEESPSKQFTFPSFKNGGDFHDNNQTPSNSPYPTNDPLGNYIESNLREMKEKMMLKLNEYKGLLEMKYDDHIERIKINVIQKANRIKQVFNHNLKNENMMNSRSSSVSSPKKEYEYMRKYTFKNVEEKLDQIFDIHEKIETSLEKNFDILGNFLDNFDFFHGNPLQNFVNGNAEDILNSWIFSKINFEKINTISLLENDKIPTILKNFIFQDTVNKFSMISIKKSRNYDFEKKLMYDNHLILEKLRLKNLDHNEFQKVFSQISSIDGIQFKKLKEILITECTIESIMFNSFFPNTEKIIIKNCILKFNFQNISRDFSKLKNLKITKSNLNSKSLIPLLEDFCKSTELLENLEILDLSNNKISLVDLSPLSNENKKFYSLQVLILSKNKIYKFKPQNLSCLPNIKIINLSSNNFTTSKDFVELQEKSRKLSKINYFSFNKNLFLMNNNIQNDIYIQYLVNNLNNLEYFLRKLDISYTFTLFNRHQTDNLQLNSNIQISLKKLNLSYNSLETNSVMTFIKNNSGFINLRILNLCNNFLDDTFLNLYISENFIHLLENLEYLDLSYNKITEKSLPNIENIIKNQKKINLLKLNYNPVENRLMEHLNMVKCNESDNNNSIVEDPSDQFEDFFDNLLDIKKDFKIVFNKNLENLVNTTQSGFLSKRNRELNKVILFEV